MSAHDLIRELSAVGVSVRVTNGELEVEGPRSLLNQQLLARIRPQKRALLGYLLQDGRFGPGGSDIGHKGQGLEFENSNCANQAVLANWHARSSTLRILLWIRRVSAARI